MRIRIGVLLVLGLTCSGAVGAQDTLRCRGGLVTVGMIAPQVVAKCGEPANKQVEQIPIHARGGRSGVVIGVALIEHWLLDRGNEQFPARLTFEEGKLKRIELLTRR